LTPSYKKPQALELYIPTSDEVGMRENLTRTPATHLCATVA